MHPRSEILGIIVVLYVLGTSLSAQRVDISDYKITAIPDHVADRYFTGDRVWRGADGAGSIDLGNGRVLWLFGDSFISRDGKGSRNGYMVRNSVGIQEGYDLTAPIRYYWHPESKKRNSFFNTTDETWFWPGHGAMIDDRLIIFLFQLRGVKTGLGFEGFHWNAALVSNPQDPPNKWKIKYIGGQDTFAVLAGSGAVIRNDEYLYAFSAQAPSTNDVYLLRWPVDRIYEGDFSNIEWWIDGQWSRRSAKEPIPQPLFRGQTEFSVHWDRQLKKYVQIQSFGFGEASIGVRLSNRLEGPWSEPHVFFKPDFTGITEPMMYSAKSHPELRNAAGVYVTYNLNAEFSFLVKNQTIYFPKFVTVKIEQK